MSKSRNIYRGKCYQRTISRSGFATYYRFFIVRMERIR
nr:RNA polymerase beta' subunit [Helleborus atrorubens]